MQDIRPAGRGSIRPQVRQVAPVVRRVPPRRSTGMSIDAVKTVTYQDFNAPNLTITVTVRPETKVHLARTVHKAILLHEVVRRAQLTKIIESQAPKKHVLRRFFTHQAVLGGLAALVLVATGYLSIDTWLTNQRAKATFSEAAASDSSGVTSQTSAGEGKDETELPKNYLANYKVSADLPRALYIDKLNIAARILPMGVNNDGSVKAPVGIFDAGWYNGSSKPGETGAVLIDGHASGPTREGLFAYLDKLVIGDIVTVEKGDGSKLNYSVVFTENVPLETVDMGKMLLPYGNSTQGLNMITCTGKWLDDKKTYDHRMTVYAERVE